MNALDKVLEWATTAGSTLRGVKVAECDGRGRGMVATEYLAKGTVVARIVPEVLLTTAEAKAMLSPALCALAPALAPVSA